MKMLLALGLVLITTGCVTSTVDEMVFNEPLAGIGDSTVVILGRRHASDYETEPDFIECVGDHISRRDNSITVAINNRLAVSIRLLSLIELRAKDTDSTGTFLGTPSLLLGLGSTAPKWKC